MLFRVGHFVTSCESECGGKGILDLKKFKHKKPECLLVGQALSAGFLVTLMARSTGHKSAGIRGPMRVRR